MPTEPAFPCSACGMEFGPRWALMMILQTLTSAFGSP